MTEENIKKMIELSLNKKTILNNFLKLTNLQTEIIEQEDMDKLGEVLDAKDKLMKQVDLIDLDFIGLYNQIKSQEGIVSLEHIDTKKYNDIKILREVVSDVSNILKDISTIDRNNSAKMKSNVDKVKSDLKQVKEVKKAYKGYNYEPVISMMIDEKK